MLDCESPSGTDPPSNCKSGPFKNTSLSHRLLGNLMWPVTRQRIKKKYDATSKSAPDSCAKLELELDWLNEKLADGHCAHELPTAAWEPDFSAAE